MVLSFLWPTVTVVHGSLTNWPASTGFVLPGAGLYPAPSARRSLFRRGLTTPRREVYAPRLGISTFTLAAPLKRVPLTCIIIHVYADFGRMTPSCCPLA